jgi:uncharacterized protein (TIGR03545 family)
MDNAANPEKKKTEKPRYKKQGPIRTEAVVPFLSVVALILLYFMLFFDGHLRRGIEWAATRGNGAEVNIAYLKTGFFDASFAMGGIQMTDPSETVKNRVQIGRMELKFLWDGLLRAKFVIDKAGITGIEIGTARKKPGFVLPPASPGDPHAPSLTDRAKDKLTQVALGELEKILTGLDPTKNLQDLGNLKCVVRAGELKAELNRKEADWKNGIAALPSAKDVEALQKQLETIRSDGTSNPAELLNRAGQVRGIIQEIDGKINAVRSLGDTLIKDVNSFAKSVGELDDLAKLDRADLEKRLKIPRLDAKGIAEQLFGKIFLARVGEAEHYITLARKYIPVKSAGKVGPKEEKPERARGRNYAFGHPRGYPKFWLRKAEISSKGEHSALGADVSGEVLDLTTDQEAIGKPTVIHLLADFPKNDVRRVDAKVTIDHRGEVPEESFTARVASYPVGNMSLSGSESVKFGFAKAVGSAGITADIKGRTILFTVENTFRDINYQIGAQSKLLESILQGVAKEIRQVSVEARLNGSWDNPQVSISSNLAASLEKGLGKQAQVKLAEARKKLEEMVQAQIEKPKAEILDRYNSEKTKYLRQIEERKKLVETLKGQAQKKLTGLTGAGQGNNIGDQFKNKMPF